MQDTDFSQFMTPFDQKITSRPLQLLKIMLPFLPPTNQRAIGICIKFLEFQNVLHSFQGMHTENDPFDEIRKIFPPSVWESYEEMMTMFSMFQEMQGTSDLDPMSMMSDMFQMQGKEDDTDDGLAK